MTYSMPIFLEKLENCLKKDLYIDFSKEEQILCVYLEGVKIRKAEVQDLLYLILKQMKGGKKING